MSEEFRENYSSFKIKTIQPVVRGSGHFPYRINTAYARACPVMTGVVNLGEMCRTPRAIHYYPGRFLHRRRRRRRLRRTLDRMNLSKQYTKYLKTPAGTFFLTPKRSPH